MMYFLSLEKSHWKQKISRHTHSYKDRDMLLVANNDHLRTVVGECKGLWEPKGEPFIKLRSTLSEIKAEVSKSQSES